MKKFLSVILAVVIIFSSFATTFASAIVPGPTVSVVSTIDLLESNPMTSWILAPLHLLEDIIPEEPYNELINFLLMFDFVYLTTKIMGSIRF